jgi:hypothetical protein
VMTHGVPLAAAEAEFVRLLVRVPAADRLARGACLELAAPSAVH